MTAFRVFFGPLLLSLRTTMPTPSILPAASTVAALCREGRLNEAVHLLHNIQHIVDSSTYVHLLQCCIRKKALHQGKRIHALLLNRNQQRSREEVYLHNTLLQMYVKCGSLVDARGVFDGMIERDVFTWNFMITAYRKQGFCEEVLALFNELQRNVSGVQPNEFVFSNVVPACADLAFLEEGVDIHRKITRRGFQSNVVVTNALIDMYAKFGNMQKACVLFDKMQKRDTISWTVMIAGYAQNGLHEEALEVFEGMQRNGVVPNEVTFASVLPACANSASMEEGVDIHHKIIRNGLHSDVVVTTSLIDMYAKFGKIQKARVLFDKIQQRNTISWNVMIGGYARNGFHEEALELFVGMQRNDVAPNEVTFVCVLPACASSASMEENVDIHRKIIRSGFHLNVLVTNALIDMYAKFGKIQKAHVLYDKMQQRDIILWNSMTPSHGIQ